MNPDEVPSLADSSSYLPEFDTRSQDNFFYAPPEGSHGDDLQPQSHEWWMALVGHEFLQIPGDSAKFTTPSLLASESSLDSDPVEPLMDLIASQDITSVTYSSPSLDGKMQLGKPSRAEDSVEDERDGSATSILSNETAVCQWKNCVAKFRNRSELRKHVRFHTLCAKFCEWAECKRFAEKRAILNKHLDTHIKPHVCPERGCVHRAATLRDIQRHTCTHRSLSRYYCLTDGCKRSFSRNDNVVRHIKKEHPLTSAKPILNLTRAL